MTARAARDVGYRVSVLGRRDAGHGPSSLPAGRPRPVPQRERLIPDAPASGTKTAAGPAGTADGGGAGGPDGAEKTGGGGPGAPPQPDPAAAGSGYQP